VCMCVCMHVHVCVCVSALAAPYLSNVELSWNKVVGGRLPLLLDALQPSVIQELRLSSCQLTVDDLAHLGNFIHLSFTTCHFLPYLFRYYITNCSELF